MAEIMGKTKGGLSRRNFLKGAGVGAAGMLGAAALSACTPGASAQASNSASKGTWDEETDVIIVGSGAAGVSSAMAALDAGAEVIMLDKQPMLGGVSSVCEQYCAYDSSLHLPQNFDDVEDSAEIMLEDAMRVSGNTADKALAKIYCDRSAESIDWMIEHGCEFKNTLRVSDGRRGQGKYILTTPGDLTTKFTADIEAAGGATKTGAAMTDLVRDEESGRIVGVVYEDGKKGTKRIKARKGVVLCTGPWSDDEVMISRHVPAIPEIPAQCAETLAGFGMPYGPYTGEAVRSAQKQGAAVRHMEYVMFDPYYSVPEVMSQKIAPAGVTRAVNQVLLSPEGNRFTDEGQSRGAIALDVLDLPGNVYYPVIDGHHLPDATGSIKFPAETLDKWVDAGQMAKGETLEDLAVAMESTFGIPQAAALATLQRYNEFCATGEDAEFGKDSHNMTPIDQAPFYAGPAETCRAIYTHGGLDTDENSRVKDVDGNVIPSLYAAGMCTGGQLGAITISGNWQMCAIVYGRIAGENVAAEATAE